MPKTILASITLGWVNRKVMRRLIILFSTLFVSSSLLAQKLPKDGSIDLEILAEKLHNEVNKVRKKHKADALERDSILLVAALDQSNYLLKKSTLTHSQASQEKRSPQKRVEYYKGEHVITGENAAFTYILVPVKPPKGKVRTNTTYEETAEDIVQSWIKSKGHFTNMISTDYSLSGMGLTYDPKKKKIVAVQVFGSLDYKN